MEDRKCAQENSENQSQHHNWPDKIVHFLWLFHFFSDVEHAVGNHEGNGSYTWVIRDSAEVDSCDVGVNSILRDIYDIIYNHEEQAGCTKDKSTCTNPLSILDISDKTKWKNDHESNDNDLNIRIFYIMQSELVSEEVLEHNTIWNDYTE